MKSGHEKMKEMLPGYQKGSLDGEMSRDVETHLKQCTECRAELAFLSELASSEVPDPGELFWNTLPGKVRLKAEAGKRKAFAKGALFRWVPAAAGVFLLLVFIYTHMHRKEMHEEDLFFQDPLSGSVTDYAGITEDDIPQITLQLADDELYLFRGSPPGYSYQREFVSLNAREMENLYEAMKAEQQTGG